MKALRTKNTYEIAFVKCKLIVIPVASPSPNGLSINLTTIQETGKGIEKNYFPLQINKPMSKEFTYQQISDIEKSLTIPETIATSQQVEHINLQGTLLMIDQAEVTKKIFGSLTSDDFEIIDSPILL